MVRSSLVIPLVMLAVSWVILVIGAFATVATLLTGGLEWWMVFLPMWAIVTALMTYAAWDDRRKIRTEAEAERK